MTKFLIDEMFPPPDSSLLHDSYGHDAEHVSEGGLQAVDDALVAATARAEARALVTENVADFAGERDVVLVFVLKRNLPAGDAQAAGLAELLDGWAANNPEPYVGPHWPTSN